jgi:hypothetical protein
MQKRGLLLLCVRLHLIQLNHARLYGLLVSDPAPVCILEPQIV